jgi:hypothetical protein
MKLFTVTPIRRKSGEELPPRYDLAPMNHFAACNFMDACRNAATDYKLHEWPADVPHGKRLCLAAGYARDKGKPVNLAEYPDALEARDYLEARQDEANRAIKAFPREGPMGLTADHVKATPEWQEAHRAYQTATRDLGQFNQGFLKRFKKQWQATLAERRANPAPVSR